MPIPALSFVDRVIFNATTAGASSFVQAGAVPGYQTMQAAGAANGAKYGYSAQTSDLSEWEVGYGTWTLSSQTLTRTVLFNSDGTAVAHNFTSVPQVMVTALAESLSAAVGGGTVTEVDTGTGLTGGPITSLGTIALANTAVGPGSYTNTNLTVDQQGRLTAASTGSSGPTAANPTGTAGPNAVNGVATSFMRSDAAPAVQLGSAAQKGIVQVDNSTITAAAGVITAVIPPTPVGANPTAIAKDTVVNGSAATFMRSDAAPAVQKASASQFGIVEVDGVTVTAAGGVISSQLINATNGTYFVRTVPAAGTISAANPGVVTATAHGLQVNDPVAFSIIRTWVPVTSISNGSPALVTKTAHGLAVGDPVAFINSGNGVLNTGLTPNTTYYVTSNGTFNVNQFNVSDTQAHALAGTNTINTSSAGTGTQDFYRTGALPPNVTEGAVYYVIATGLTANAFEFSATVGGTGVDCTGTQTGNFVWSTGNDSNNGLAQTRTGAFMTIQAAADYFSNRTFTNEFTQLGLADGTYYESVVLGTLIGGSNSDASPGVGILGWSGVVENVIVRGVAADGWAFAGMGSASWTLGFLSVEVSGGGGNAIENFGIYTHLFLQTINFGNCSCPVLSGGTFDHGGEVYLTGSGNKITGASQGIGFFADKYGYLEISHGDLTFCVNPSWPYFIRAERGSNTYINRGDFTYNNAAVFTGSQIFVDTLATVLIKVGRYTDLPGVSTNNMIEGGWVNDSSGTYTYVALSDRTWFVNPSTGSDENNGSVGSPFQTIQYAANYVAKYDWYLGFQPQIDLADSLLYSENNIVLPQLKNLWVYLGRFAKILGSLSTNVKITDVPGNGVFYLEGSMSWWYISGISLDTPFVGFKVYNSAFLTLGEIGFTDSTAGNNCVIVWCETLSTINWVGSGTSKLTITNPGGGLTVGGTMFLGAYQCRIDLPGIQIAFPASSPSVPNLGMFDLQGSCVAFFSNSTWTGGADLSPQIFMRENCSILTTNGLLSELPGIQTNNYIDASSSFSGEGSGHISQFAFSPCLRPNGNVRNAITTQVGTTYTANIRDAGNVVEMNTASSNTFTVPTNASVPFPVGTKLTVVQIGAGTTTIAAAGGVTVHNVAALSAQYAPTMVYKRGTDEWVQVNGAF